MFLDIKEGDFVAILGHNGSGKSTLAKHLNALLYPTEGTVFVDGKDVKQLIKDWTAHYRSLLITKFIKNPEDMLNMSAENIDRIREQSHQISLDEINTAILRLSKTLNDARWSTQPRILLELAIVAIATDLIDEDRPQQRKAAPAVQYAAPAVQTQPVSALARRP